MSHRNEQNGKIQINGNRLLLNPRRDTFLARRANPVPLKRSSAAPLNRSGASRNRCMQACSTAALGSQHGTRPRRAHGPSHRIIVGFRGQGATESKPPRTGTGGVDSPNGSRPVRGRGVRRLLPVSLPRTTTTAPVPRLVSWSRPWPARAEKMESESVVSLRGRASSAGDASQRAIGSASPVPGGQRPCPARWVGSGLRPTTTTRTTTFFFLISTTPTTTT